MTAGNQQWLPAFAQTFEKGKKFANVDVGKK